MFDPQMQHQFSGLMRQYGDALKQGRRLKDLKARCAAP
jgi:hypothetical protein